MNIGIIEGFYGEDWGFESRHTFLRFMVENQLRFFIYAPKGDRHLRARWTERHPHQFTDELAGFSEACRENGILFGVGLTPLNLHQNWAKDGRRVLKRRIAELSELKLDILAILFDDMRGDMPNLAKTQADMMKAVCDQGVSKHHIMCPTYYCDPGILDRLFGQRPPSYLEHLGSRLEPEVDVFWTGPKVLSTTFPDAHLDAVTNQLGRKPFIWDNYPVNDGPRMSRHLHLRAVERSPSMLDRVSGIAINPMNQPHLSMVPIYAMMLSLSGKSLGEAREATLGAIRTLCPGPLADLLEHDWIRFQDDGLDALADAARGRAEEYARIDHPAAREVSRWLRGEYRVSADILTDDE